MSKETKQYTKAELQEQYKELIRQRIVSLEREIDIIKASGATVPTPLRAVLYIMRQGLTR